MNYSTGERVKIGDRVSLGGHVDGVVVCDVDANEFCAEFPQNQWETLERGVLVDFPSYGLIHYERAIEPNVRLVARSD